MDKCRICLLSDNNLRSVFEDECNRYITYAAMIASISNVKITHEDRTYKICFSCIRKLEEVYDFKLLIERNNNTLQQNAKQVIYFNNINDINLDIKNKDVPKLKNGFNIFKDKKDTFYYDEIIITKCNSKNCKEKESLSVLEFLETIKQESNGEHNNDYVVEELYGGNFSEDGDIDYFPPNVKENKLKKKYRTKKKMNKLLKRDKNINIQSNVDNLRMVIKPVFVEDLQLVRTKIEKIKQKNKDNKKLREEICPYCGKLSKSMKKHLLIHGERNFNCEECPKAFYTEAGLMYHKKKHVNIKNFKCDKCIASFNNKTALQSHMLSHVEIKKHVCNICSKPFKRKGAMVRHSLIHNSANKCIKCEQCNMSFFTKYGLRHHMRVHTGERPYICEICSQPYSYKHDFNRHCLNKHGVFLKRRAVYVMNEEVLVREKTLMRDLMLRLHGITKDGEPFNPFENEGPQGALAFEQAIKALQSRKIPLDFQL